MTPDVITFDVEVTWNARPGVKDDTAEQPARVCCGVAPIAAVRADVARGFTFPHTCKGEDQEFTRYAKKRGVTVKHIPKVLYRQHYRSSKPEFGGHTYRDHQGWVVGL